MTYIAYRLLDDKTGNNILGTKKGRLRGKVQVDFCLWWKQVERKYKRYQAEQKDQVSQASVIGAGNFLTMGYT